jgi:hypothetical protein
MIESSLEGGWRSYSRMLDPSAGTYDAAQEPAEEHREPHFSVSGGPWQATLQKELKAQ